MARAFAPQTAVNASRYLIVPCEADGCGAGGMLDTVVSGTAERISLGMGENSWRNETIRPLVRQLRA